MIVEDKAAFLVRRYTEDSTAADAATTLSVRLIHLELAMRYSILAAQRTNYASNYAETVTDLSSRF